MSTKPSIDASGSEKRRVCETTNQIQVTPARPRPPWRRCSFVPMWRLEKQKTTKVNQSGQTSAEPSELSPTWGPEHQLSLFKAKLKNQPFQISTNLCSFEHLGKAGTNTVTYWKRHRRSASSSPPRSRGSAAWTCSPGQPSYQRTWGQVKSSSSFDPTVTSKRWRRQEALHPHSLVLAAHSQTFHLIGDAIRRNLWVGEHLVSFSPSDNQDDSNGEWSDQ